MAQLSFWSGHSSSFATVRCQTTGCSRRATVLCDFPITRNGRKGSCNRHICGTCAKRLGSRQFCPPHARIAGDGITICARCYTSSCVAGDMPCDAAGTVRVVTDAEWLYLLSFGACGRAPR
jgi:hypothetical protein